jgi:oxygen-independent coproporphyrinogen-3 oxidase
MFILLPLVIEFQFEMTKPGIYIHIPFCVQKCRYCDFYSVTDASLREPFVVALVREIEGATVFPDPPDTLYFGGGTPSVLEPDAIFKVLEAARRRFSLLEEVEVTLEVNPGTVTRDRLRAYRDAGVNRLNIGVQSFDDGILSFLGRCHSGLEARQAITWAREAGFENVGLDLIYGVPDQTLENWWEALEAGRAFSPEHFSCYMLTYEPGTPLDRLRVSGSIEPMGDDSAAAFFDTTLGVLANAGYEHYEISNFARHPDLRSRHNQKYWDHTPYLGFGPAAHSFSGSERRWNISDVSAYIERVEAGESPTGDTEKLTPEQVMVETVYLGLRTGDGIDLVRFEKNFGTSFEDLFDAQVKLLREEGLLTLSAGRCALTRRGMRFHDFITARFVDEMG